MGKTTSFDSRKKLQKISLYLFTLVRIYGSRVMKVKGRIVIIVREHRGVSPIGQDGTGRGSYTEHAKS